jgi:membrane associated rhomboid family serine protease
MRSDGLPAPNSTNEFLSDRCWGSLIIEYHKPCAITIQLAPTRGTKIVAATGQGRNRHVPWHIASGMPVVIYLNRALVRQRIGAWPQFIARYALRGFATMVMPIGDDNTGRTIAPFVNYALLAANVLVFIFCQGMGSNERFTYAFSTVPKEIVSGEDIETAPRRIEIEGTGQEVEVPGLERTPISVYITLITSMFMHGGIAHLFGNMLFLWIFGDNIEDTLGHVRYLLFYIVCGLVASLSHVMTTVLINGPGSEQMLIPSLGASGAISGVLGGYIMLHPHRRVMVILFRMITEVPAYVAIGMWFLFQLVSSLGMFGGGSQVGGVAYAAHIGGFIAGLVLIHPFAIGKTPSEYHVGR